MNSQIYEKAPPPTHLSSLHHPCCSIRSCLAAASSFFCCVESLCVSACSFSSLTSLEVAWARMRAWRTISPVSPLLSNNWSVAVRIVSTAPSGSYKEKHSRKVWKTGRVTISLSHISRFHTCKHRGDSRFAPSQWEMAVLCNNVSHWLGASLELAL